MVASMFVLAGLGTDAFAQKAAVPSGWKATPPVIYSQIASDDSAAAFLRPLVGGPVNPPYYPADVAGAYKLDSASLAATTLTNTDGAGETIYIVDAYGDTSLNINNQIVDDVQSDLSTFSTEFSLPYVASGANQTLTEEFPDGNPTAPNADWAIETALDVEWAHAIAPGAKIVLVVTPDNGSSLYQGAIYAGENGSIVSMSWGGAEFVGESADDDYYFGDSGVAYFAATGDSGSGVIYPSVSPNVVAVGGTSLNIFTPNGTTDNWLSETGWSGSGGGISADESTPSYQSFNTAGGREVPDVAAIADPNTGVYVLQDATSFQVGGTSLATPFWAGVTALLDGNLTDPAGSTALHNVLYYLYLSGQYDTYFHDITSGSNGAYSAGGGYDLVTGIGSPIGNEVLPEIVNLLNATTVLTEVTVSNISGLDGQTVTLAAALTAPFSGTALSGKTLSFEVDATAVGTATTDGNGVATIQYTVPGGDANGSTHTISVTFAGDSNDQADTGTGTLTIQTPTLTSFVFNPQYVYYQDDATGYVTISSTAPEYGTYVNLNQYPYDVYIPGLSSQGSFSYPNPDTNVPGSQTVTATYNNGLPISSTVYFTDFETDLAVANVGGPAGSTVSLTATLTDIAANSPGVADEPVAFTIDGQQVGTAYTNDAGVATLSYVVPGNFVYLSTHTIGATFAGDPDDAPSSGTGTLTVAIQPILTLTEGTAGFLTAPFSATAVSGDATSLSYVWSVTPTANALFGSAATGTTPSSATFTNVLTTTATGTYTVKVKVTDDNSQTATSSIVVTLPAASTSTTIASTPNPSIVGQSVTFTSTVTGTENPTGVVTFIDTNNVTGGKVTLGSATLIGDAATFTTTQLSQGTHYITAVYGGDAYNATSTSSTLTQPVTLTPSTTALTSSANPSAFGEAVTFTSTVTEVGGTPTGTVTFTIDGTSYPAVQVGISGVATYSTAILAVGAHTVTASYSGDLLYGASTSSALTQTVTEPASSTVLTSSENPSTYGDNVVYTATVSGTGGTPTGTIAFSVDGTAVSTETLSNGTASFTSTTLTAGSHSVTAVYSGDTNFAASSATPLTQVVNQAASTTTLVTSLNPATSGQTVTFTTTIAGPGSVPTGSVTFSVDGTPQSPVTLVGGVATYATTSLPTGTHAITAAYSGDTNFSASTGTTLSEIINAAGTVIPTPTITSLSPGSGPIGTTVTINGTNLTGAVSVAFSGGTTAVPTNVTATSLTAVVPTGTTTGDVSVTTPGGTATSTTPFTVSTVLHNFQSGLIMISAPVDDSAFSLSQDFDQTVKFAVWNPATSSYAVSPTSPADTVRPAQGYWARIEVSTNLLDLNTTVSGSQPISFALAAGWNIIGVPRTSAISSNALSVAPAGGSAQTFGAAVANGLISSTLYTYQAGDTNYETIDGATASLQPYHGYWIYASQSVTLNFAPQ